MQLKFYIPFKAQAGVDEGLAIREHLLNIEGTAIDTSVNKNKWQVPQEDLDFFVQSLQGKQLRIDHGESALSVVGKVSQANRLANSVWFRAELGDAGLIEKVLRGYLNYVSAQVDSDDVECSSCHAQTRKDGVLIHLCPNAWEIVHKPQVRELSIIASPAYKNTSFTPVGFAAAMDASQGYHESEMQGLIRRLNNAKRTLDKLQASEEREELQQLRTLQRMAHEAYEMLDAKPCSTAEDDLRRAVNPRAKPLWEDSNGPGLMALGDGIGFELKKPAPKLPPSALSANPTLFQEKFLPPKMSGDILTDPESMRRARIKLLEK